MSVHIDWREPLRLLELHGGAPTTAQLELARREGLTVLGDEPRRVLIARIEDHLSPTLYGLEPHAATERQRAFLRELGSKHTGGPDLTKSIASAWIDHYLSLKTIAALRTLKPVRGELVIRHHHIERPEFGISETFDTQHVVSSVRDDGLIFFKGGNGQCGWPSNLRRPDS